MISRIQALIDDSGRRAADLRYRPEPGAHQITARISRIQALIVDSGRRAADILQIKKHRNGSRIDRYGVFIYLPMKLHYNV